MLGVPERAIGTATLEALDVPVRFELADRGALRVPAVAAHGLEVVQVVLPIVGEREHEGERALGFEAEGGVSEGGVPQDCVVAGRPVAVLPAHGVLLPSSQGAKASGGWSVSPSSSSDRLSLRRLHVRQAVTRLSRVFFPPRLTGTRWSTTRFWRAPQ